MHHAVLDTLEPSRDLEDRVAKDHLEGAHAPRAVGRVELSRDLVARAGTRPPHGSPCTRSSWYALEPSRTLERRGAEDHHR